MSTINPKAGEVIDTAPPTDKFDLTVTMTHSETGVDTPVKISVEYPKDHGLVAIQALRKMAEPSMIVGLLEALQSDPSVRAKLAEEHLAFDTDDNDEEPFWPESSDGWDEDKVDTPNGCGDYPAPCNHDPAHPKV